MVQVETGVRDVLLPNTVLYRSFEMLPSFLILGAQKAGTSSLYEYLRQHPDLRLPRSKEIHFFDLNYARGLKWYRRKFRSPGTTRASITGEATPYYLFHPAVAERVAADLPGIKLVVMLRDPVSRAYSHFRMSVRKGNEDLDDFETALAAENERLNGETAKVIADPRYRSFSHQKHSYFARGLYSQQLRHWLQFFELSRFHIIQSESFFENPKPELQALATFLELDQFEFSPVPVINSGDYAPVAAATRRRLAERYREPNRDLEALLNRDFRWP